MEKGGHIGGEPAEEVVPQHDISEIIENIEEQEVEVEKEQEVEEEKEKEEEEKEKEEEMVNVESIYISKREDHDKQIEQHLHSALESLRLAKVDIQLSNLVYSRNIQDKQDVVNRDKFLAVQEELASIAPFYTEPKPSDSTAALLETYSQQLVRIFQQKVQQL